MKDMKDKSKRLTPRLLKTAKLLPVCKTVKEAGIKAGYSENYAKTNLYKKIDNDSFKDTVQREIEKALVKAGVTEEKRAKVYQEALNATRLRTWQGEVLAEEPDHFIRLKAEELIAKIRGDFAPDKLNVEVGRTQAEKIFQERAERLKALKEGGNSDQDNPPKTEQVEDSDNTLEDKKIDE